MKRPSFFQLKNGSKAKLPFTDNEYENRLKYHKERDDEKMIRDRSEYERLKALFEKE